MERAEVHLVLDSPLLLDLFRGLLHVKSGPVIPVAQLVLVGSKVGAFRSLRCQIVILFLEIAAIREAVCKFTSLQSAETTAIDRNAASEDVYLVIFLWANVGILG